MVERPEYSPQAARAKLLGARVEQYQTLLTVVDPRPRVVGLGGVKRDDESTNKDFIVINGNLEIRRDFALKVLGMFQFGWEIVGTPDQQWDSGKLLGVTVLGKVTTPEGVSFSCLGSCQPGEDAPKKWASSRGGGGLHACVAIAETRAAKRGVEAAIGAPVLNMLMKEVFPEWEWEDGANRPKPMRNVSPQREAMARGESVRPQQRSPQIERIRRKLKALVDAEVYSADEAQAAANRAYASADKTNVLSNIEREIEREFASRGMEVPK